MSSNEIMEIFKGLELFTRYLSAAAPYIFFLAGIGLIIFDRYNAFKLSRRKNIQVAAKITKSELVEYLSHGTNTSTMMYRPVIEYVYKVEDQSYQSAQISYSSRSFSTNDKAQIQALISQYPIDKTVNIFVNSENFEDTYLLEKSPNEWVVLAIGSVLILCGFVIHVIFN